MWGAIVGLIGDANKKESAYRIQAAQAKTAASIAKMNATSTAYTLERNFNQRMASNAVISASQGRRGGSVTAIANAAQAELNWDLEFTKLGGDLSYMNRLAEVTSYETAATTAQTTGYASAALSLLSSQQKYKQIG